MLKKAKLPNLAFTSLLWKHPTMGPRIAGNMIKARLGRPVLRTLEASITDECPGSCPHCFAADRITGRPLLSAREWQVVIDEAVELGAFIIQFSGGEPLVREDLAEMISMVPSNLAIAVLTTSAFGLDRKRMVELARAGLDVLIVSLDSDVAREHDAFRGLDGCFSQAVSALKIGRELGMATMVNFMILGERLSSGTAGRVYGLARSLDAQLNIFLPAGLGRWSDRPAENLSRAQRDELTRLLSLRGVRWCGLSNYVGTGCGAGTEKLSVLADGDVVACSVLPDPVFGNVRDFTLFDIWVKAGKQASKASCPAADLSSVARGKV